MALLRSPIPVGLRSAAAKAKISNYRAGPPMQLQLQLQLQKKSGVRASVEQRQKGIVRTREEMEMAVLELERLFKKGIGDYDTLLPRLSESGPSHPSPAIGSSGRPVRVAYQGVRGSYCQEAAIKAFSPVCNAFPCSHMDDAFRALEDGTADRAIIPVENSIDGPIDRNFDLLLRHSAVGIVGEFILPVNHCLLALPGSSTSHLKRIISHPQALSHCRINLHAPPLHDYEIDEVPNAADAARYVSENRIADTAVIGSEIAAREFGLQVLHQNFQDETGNFNRFLQLGLQRVEPSRSRSQPQRPLQGGKGGFSPWKTTVAFSLENGVSDLFRALWLFESRNVTVTRVDQRPNRSNPVRAVEKETGYFRYLDYVFILDLEGSVSESGVASGLAQLKEISGGFMKVLGSYTCGSIP